jgi:enamine deaminase RidA (YjgF/YER057c/UK114 family)
MKRDSDSFEVRFLERENVKECWIVSAQDHCEGIGILQKIFTFLKTHGFDAVSMRLFGSREDLSGAALFLETKKTEIVCPSLFILHNDSTKKSCLGVQVHAVLGARLKSLYFEDQLVGRQFEDDYTKYYMLGILPDNPLASEYSQSQNIFEKADKILKSFDSKFSETIRTWLFARDILSWYGQLNKARNQFFEYHDIYNKLIPASTGIGAANLHNMAMTAQVLATIPKNKAVSVYSVKSPLQCPALDYKSSFSRAIKLDSPDHSRLYISGTASIDKAGKTVFLDDTSAQLEFTMQVVKAILDEAGMDWSNTVSSMVYFKNQSDFGLFDAYCRQKDIQLPHIKVHADVCRDDLLFELELDAVRVVR